MIFSFNFNVCHQQNRHQLWPCECQKPFETNANLFICLFIYLFVCLPCICWKWFFFHETHEMGNKATRRITDTAEQNSFPHEKLKNSYHFEYWCCNMIFYVHIVTLAAEALQAYKHSSDCRDHSVGLFFITHWTKAIWHSKPLPRLNSPANMLITCNMQNFCRPMLVWNLNYMTLKTHF